MREIEIDGQRALGFDTGLSARAFAQAKFAQFITESGVIVRSAEAAGRVEWWKASGVREIAGPDGPTMVFWGPPVEGDSLNALLENRQENALCGTLAAISVWIQAILELEGTAVPLWPCAAAVALEGGLCPAVFFAPPSLVMRNIMADDERYVNPGLSGMDAAAFTAAAMLYRAFAGVAPFSADDISLIRQDMNDGNFLPIRLAVPGLDARLAALIQTCLSGMTCLEANNGAAALAEILAVLNNQTATGVSLIQPVSETDRLLLEKEKAKFLKIKTASVKTRRFLIRNTALLISLLAAAAGAAFITYSILSSRARLPTTAGMDPVQVIESYYRAFGELDHQMMEACITGKAGKDDVRTAINFFVLNKTRQAYEFNAPPVVLPAHEWQGGRPDSPLFGASDLRVKRLDGDESGGIIRYRLDYTFWIPAQAAEPSTEIQPEAPLSLSYPRTELVTLVRKKGNWQISEIIRE